MTDRSKSYENAGYISGKMVNDLSPRKTMLVLVIVVGCFAVLWPKVFYPMLVGSANNRIKPSSIDRTQGCCDVIYEKDVTTIKLMSEICNTIIKNQDENTLSNKELIQKCQNIVLDTCGIDISAVLQEQVRLGHTTKQILEEIRSLNGSLCLKYNFGVAPWKLGVPHRVTVKMSPSSIRQERPLHLRSEMVHPAFRERGRAIPQPEFAPTKPASPSHIIKKVVEGRPGPIPGMRPTIGGAGHVVPPSKQSGNSMGLIMPLYTIGIVVFFAYTVMKIVFKKQSDVLYHPVNPDPHFRREVFEADRGHLGSKLPKEPVSSKLVVNAMSALLDEVDMELSSRRKANDVKQEEVVANGSLASQEEDQSSVQIVGMETTASRENGQKWISSSSPLLPVVHPLPSDTPPQEIFLEGSLPPQSHLLVTDSATEAQKLDVEEDPAVVLAGKMTLSVISLDSSENGTEETSSISGKKPSERSSSNVSEEFEKIDAAQLEEDINDIIATAEHMSVEGFNKETNMETQIINPPDIRNILGSNKNLDKTITNEVDSESLKENAVSIENLIEESVGVVVETIQDKQKEFDDLLLKTEEDLAKTTEFVDSKIDQIQKDLAHIEGEQNKQQSMENDKYEEFVIIKEGVINTNNIEKEQIETSSKEPNVELIEIKDKTKEESFENIEDLNCKQQEAPKDAENEREQNMGAEVETKQEHFEVYKATDEIPEKVVGTLDLLPHQKEIVDTLKEEIIQKETLEESPNILEGDKIDDKKQSDTIESACVKGNNSVEETLSQNKLQEEQNKNTKTDATKDILGKNVDLEESDNEQEDDEINLEENLNSRLPAQVFLDNKNIDQKVDEEESEEEYEEEEVEEESDEEIDQEIVEYISEEEGEVEEDDDIEEIEASKVISHV